MKSLTILLLAVSSIGMAQTKQQYHIKVECYGTPYAETQYYRVAYTIDNWDSEANLMDTFDTSIAGINGVNYQLDLFDNEREAINFARQFKTYRSCLDYNNKIYKKYQRLSAYRKAHPTHADPEPLLKKNKCCKVTQIY